MGQEYDKFPKTNVGTHQPEQIWRDWEMFNIHINSHKMRWLKDVTDIMDCHRFEDDFCNCPDITNGFIWQRHEWPGTSGAHSQCCVDMVNGVLELVTREDENDSIELTQYCECWKFLNCYPCYGEMRFHLDDAVECDFWFGYTQDNSWFFPPPQEAAVFYKNDDSALLNFETRIAGVATVSPGIATLVECEWYRLGIHWDGQGTIRYFLFQDGNFPQAVLATGSHTTNLPTTELALGFGIAAGADAQKTLAVDYVKSAQLRVIEG